MDRVGGFSLVWCVGLVACVNVCDVVGCGPVVCVAKYESGPFSVSKYESRPVCFKV